MAIRIFISSPSDVLPERHKAVQIIERLDREFRFSFRVEAIIWEREPLVATHHFQDAENLLEPRDADVVVVMLWSRMGTPLPARKFRGALSGRAVTGTEWEFENALKAARSDGSPQLLVYRKTAAVSADLTDDRALTQRRAQFGRVVDFFQRWFHTDGSAALSAAFHTFAHMNEFETQLYDHLRAILTTRVKSRTGQPGVRWHEAPFRALLPYEFEHSPVFFGRMRARNALASLLSNQISQGRGFVLVLGASGSGKSSLVKAGLLADLVLPGMIAGVGLVRRAYMRPSNRDGDLTGALAAAILSSSALSEGGDVVGAADRLTNLLRKVPDEAVAWIRKSLERVSEDAGLVSGAQSRLIVVIDQLEEIFTIETITPEQRAEFFRAVRVLEASSLVLFIATMRSDYFESIETCADLEEISRHGRFLLTPPDDQEVGQIIRLPAAEAGLQFEQDLESGESLDETIRTAARACNALPLLSFVMDQLWLARTPDGFLTFAAYNEIGGLEGAIGRAAEAVIMTLPEPIQRELSPLLRQLVTVRGTVATARTVPLTRFPEGTACRALVDALLDPSARLLIASYDSTGPQIRLAHEALLSHWPRARLQIEADARDMALRTRMEEEAEAWRAAPRAQKKLLVRMGLPLAEAKALVSRWRSELPDDIIAFVQASRRAALETRIRILTTILAVPTGAAAFVIAIWSAILLHDVRALETRLQFVSVPDGCFRMGSPADERGRVPDEGAVIDACVADLEIGKFEVTQAEWRSVMRFIDPSPSYFKGDRLPVENINVRDAERFMWLLSTFGRYRYRFPREVEWEYAARAGSQTSRYWGDNVSDGCGHENLPDMTLQLTMTDAIIAKCNDGNRGTAPVGTYLPNPWGLYDMLGNVGELAGDCYSTRPSATPISDIRSPPCRQRVVRGGSWNNVPRNARAAYRRGRDVELRNYGVGLRLVRQK